MPERDGVEPAGDHAETVHVTIPADPSYVSVLRTVTASLAARRDFTIEEIDDLRIAVDGGFMSVTEEGVTILAESAEFESEIDEHAAREDAEADDPKVAARGRARLRAVGALD